MTRHSCWPRCPACVWEIATRRGMARAELLPRVTRTVPVTNTNRLEEGTRDLDTAA